MRVTLIGSGNIATVLGRKIFAGGHIIQQVYSRNPEHAEQLANEFSCKAVTEIEDNSDMYIVAVSDDALHSIDDWMKPVSGFVVHTAGSVSIEVLKNISRSYGVIWPLQSVIKETLNAPWLPLIIDANDMWSTMKLQGFAQSFGDSVTIANDEHRRKLHVAAVITNNFTNHIFTLTETYCGEVGVDFKLLLPLLRETVNRLETDSAKDLQTGPAIRGDESTMNMHRDLLKNHKELLEVYNFFSEKIGASAKKEE